MGRSSLTPLRFTPTIKTMLDDFLPPTGLALGVDAPSLPAPFRPRPSDGKWTGKTPEEMEELRGRHIDLLSSFQDWRLDMKRDVLRGGDAGAWFEDVFAAFDARKDGGDAGRRWKVFAKRKLRPLLMDTVPRVASRECAETVLLLCGVGPDARFMELAPNRASRGMMVELLRQ